MFGIRRAFKNDEERDEYFGVLEKLGEREYTPAELREFHKILKKYGGGLPLPMRYPWVPTVMSLVALLFSVVVILLKLLVIQ